MATYTISLADICAGGDHVTLAVAKDGMPAWQIAVNADDIPALPSAEEAKQAFLALARFMAQGKTKAQIVAALQAGVDIVI